MRVVILGGGSAGWMAAASLHQRLNGGRRGPVEITVITSPDTPRIGVGEATIPTIRTFLANLGIPEAELLRACNGTIKHAIRFDDWSGPGTSYWHPFHRFTDPSMRGAAARWMNSAQRVPFAEAVSAQIPLIDTPRAPRGPGGADYTGAVPYAYHLDAEAFADLLQARATGQGVRHVSAHVEHVVREQGRVSALHLCGGAVIEADLYVDCTGFAGMLDPEGEWLDQSEHMICDRAVVMQVPHDLPVPPPFTRARALSAGWSWDIALRTRRGRGYVYASRHLSDDQAEAELRADEPADTAQISARQIRFRVGRKRAPWSGNVVSIGLAAGFLEPLESTGLYFADLATRFLLEFFPPAAEAVAAPQLAPGFNRAVTETHDQVLDFILLHYALAARRDTPFWRDASDHARLTPRLAELLALWELRPPSFADIQHPFSPFSHANYEFILMGNGWRPAAMGAPDPRAPAVGPHPGAARLVAGLPPLSEFMAAL